MTNEKDIKNKKVQTVIELGAEMYDKSQSVEAVMYLAYAMGMVAGSTTKQSA